MITDDLSTLFEPAAPGVRFRQGTVLTWDSDTGENAIDLAGATLTDVPVLNTSEATALKEGHVVGLLGQGSAWFIIGRVTPPNSSDFAGASVAFETQAAQVSNFALSTGFVEKVSTSMNVPAWADEALVTVSVTMTAHNNRGVEDFVYLYAAISGLTSGAAFTGASATSGSALSWPSLSHTHTATVSTSGPSTIAVSGYALSQGGAWTADANNRIFLAASAVYRSTV